DGKTFTLLQSPVGGAPTGNYYFKPKPIEHAHQYRYASPLAQHVIHEAIHLETPQTHLAFTIGGSDRVPTAVKDLVGQSGSL
ncbi:hypothetical protein WAJ14_20005, partial [Acinetobacter baumannii]